MKAVIARAIMVVASRCFGDRRHDWARAMQVEFEVAARAGEPLSFASGCLLSAMREMPAREEGRFTLASHVLAVGIIVPVAALLMASVGDGFPVLAPIATGVGDLLGTGGPNSITAANRGGLPLLAGLTLVLGAGHLVMAWAILERDWSRVTSIGFAAAALTGTIVIFTALLFLSDGCALPQTAVTAIELVAVWVLVRWHADLPAHGRDHRRPSPS